MSNTLGNKEFDEEDFYVSGPTNLTYTAQPITGKVNKTLGIDQGRACSTASATS